MSLIFGTQNNFLCAGARIHDIPNHPLFVCGVELHEEDVPALNRILDLRNVPIFLFNELDVNVAWSNVMLAEADAQKIREFLSSSNFYIGPFNKAASYALDCFCYSTDRTQGANGVALIDFTEVPVTFEKWHANHISFIGVNDKQTVKINDPNEGVVLERATWASLESVFPLTLHMSPQIKVGEKDRELTDVLAFHEYGSFLIEAKDLSILQSSIFREQTRRTKGVQKQTKKAITQLVGAAKAAKRGDSITDKDGKSLSINLEQPFHCIVLLSELMYDGDWQEVEQQLMQAMVDTGDFFHVLDLQELITILKCSGGDPKLFDYNLIDRCTRFAQSGTVLMRSRFAPPQENDDTGSIPPS
ncbi:hypothetical protein [uncultured Nitrosomonas sp.]|uniref:hypothetical protein n=1 Tax=uncultured Nitrosomonas sp. TaxID=156424 RepID=UPI0025EF8086|nr:hypothetical protein [uncultured Nitrosomonas sp.]